MKTQQVLLSAWIVELKLDKLNKLGSMAGIKSIDSTPTPTPTLARPNPTDIVVAYDELQMELKTFLTKYLGNVDIETIFELFQGHGRLQDSLWFAGLTV